MFDAVDDHAVDLVATEVEEERAVFRSFLQLELESGFSDEEAFFFEVEFDVFGYVERLDAVGGQEDEVEFDLEVAEDLLAEEVEVDVVADLAVEARVGQEVGVGQVPVEAGLSGLVETLDELVVFLQPLLLDFGRDDAVDELLALLLHGAPGVLADVDFLVRPGLLLAGPAVFPAARGVAG